MGSKSCRRFFSPPIDRRDDLRSEHFSSRPELRILTAIGDGMTRRRHIASGNSRAKHRRFDFRLPQGIPTRSHCEERLRH
jgi:hypothetical protein